MAPTTSPTRAPSTIESIQYNCSEGPICTIACHGFYSCYGVDLICSAPQCNIECLGQGSCAWTRIYTDSLIVSFVNITFRSYQAGLYSVINGYDTEAYSTDEWLKRVTMGRPLHIHIDAIGQSAFEAGQVLASHGTDVSVNCQDYYACSRANFSTSDAESFNLTCSSDSETCRSATVFCPTVATLNYAPGLCRVDCEYGNCAEMSLYSLGGVYGMKLYDSTGIYNYMRLRCGTRYEQECRSNYNEGYYLDCSPCDGSSESTLFETSGYMSKFNYFVADTREKYTGTRITCVDTNRPSECYIVTGFTGYSDAQNAAIYSASSGNTSLLFIVGYGRYDYRYAHIDASSASRAMLVAEISGYDQFHNALLIAPRFNLDINCRSVSGCEQLEIAQNSPSLSSFVVESNFDSESELIVNITCSNTYSCSSANYDLKNAGYVSIDCKGSIDSCTYMTLYAPTLPMSTTEGHTTDINCYDDEYHWSQSCMNLQIYAVRGTQDVNLNCYAQKDYGPQTRRLQLQSSASYQCDGAHMYCAPNYDFDCPLINNTDAVPYGYTCDSICVNFTYEKYANYVPTSAPTARPHEVDLTIDIPMLNNDNTLNPNLYFTVVVTTAFMSSEANYTSIKNSGISTTWILQDLTSETQYNLSQHYGDLASQYGLVYSRRIVGMQNNNIPTRRRRRNRRRSLLTVSPYASYVIEETFRFNQNSGFYGSSTQSTWFTKDVCKSGSELFIQGHEYKLVVSSTVKYKTIDNAMQTSSGMASTTFIANTPPFQGNCSVTPKSGTALVDLFTLSCSNWLDTSSSLLYVNFEMNGLFASSTKYFEFDTENPENSTDNPNNANIPIQYNSETNAIEYRHTLSGSVKKVTAIVMDVYGAARCIPISVTVNEAFTNVGVGQFIGSLVPQYVNVNAYLTPANASAAMNNASIAAQELAPYLAQISQINQENVNALVNLAYDIVKYTLQAIQVLDPQTLPELVQSLTILSTVTNSIGGLCTSYNIPLIDSEGNRLNGSAVGIASTAAASSEHVFVARGALDTTQNLLATATDILIPTEQNENENENAGALDTTTAANSLQTIANILSNFGCASVSTTGEEGTSFMDTAQNIGQLTAADAVTGETVTVTTPVLNVTVSRVTTDNNGDDEVIGSATDSTSCSDTVSLPNSAFAAYSNYTTDVDCSVVSSNINPYNPGQEEQDNFTGIVVDVNVSVPIPVVVENEAEGETIEVGDGASSFSNTCNPAIIKIQNKQWANYNDPTQSYPSCVFFNTTSEQWDGYGCHVWNRNTSDNSVICVCNHTTPFSLRQKSFSPDIHFLKEDSFRSITAENLAKYPAGWILVLVCFTVFAILLYIAPDVNDKPLISHSRGVWKHFRDTNWNEFRVGLENKILRSKEPLGWKILKLWYIAIRCDHMIIGLFFRYKGTGYRREARLTSFLAKLFTLTAANSFFYGTPTDPWGNDAIVSFYASLIQMPLVFVKFCFKRYQNKERADKEDMDVELQATQNLLKVIELQEQEYAKGATTTSGAVGEGENEDEVADTEKGPGTDPHTDDMDEDMYVPIAGTSTPGENKPSTEEVILNAVAAESTNDPEAEVGDGLVGTTPGGGVVILRSLNSPEVSNARTRRMTARWKPADFETMDIETLARILEATASTNTSNNKNKNNNNNTTTPTDGNETTTAALATTTTAGAYSDIDEELLVTAEQKYLASAALRRKVMDKQYSWWHWCKYAAWIFTILWTIACAIITLVFVVQFDMLRGGKNTVVIPESKCSNALGIDINDEIVTEYAMTQRSISDYVEKAETSTLSTDNGFEFRQSVSRWLMSIFIGFLLSLFVWQPLFDLILQIIKVLRFDPDEVNESYFFANASLLLSQEEREELVRSGVDMELDDNADDESHGDEEESNNNKNNNNVVASPSDASKANVLENLEQQLASSSLHGDVELVNTDQKFKE